MGADSVEVLGPSSGANPVLHSGIHGTLRSCDLEGIQWGPWTGVLRAEGEMVVRSKGRQN